MQQHKKEKKNTLRRPHTNAFFQLNKELGCRCCLHILRELPKPDPLYIVNVYAISCIDATSYENTRHEHIMRRRIHFARKNPVHIYSAGWRNITQHCLLSCVMMMRAPVSMQRETTHRTACKSKCNKTLSCERAAHVAHVAHAQESVSIRMHTHNTYVYMCIFYACMILAMFA